MFCVYIRRGLYNVADDLEKRSYVVYVSTRLVDLLAQK